MDYLTSLLGRNGFLPHGYCFTWSPGLLWSMVTADTIIAAAYFSIPLSIARFVRGRPELDFRSVAWLFTAFIAACGVTHLMDVWTIWTPDYRLHAVSKGVTAAVSLVSALAVWRLVPQALTIPTVGQLRGVIHSLEAEVAKRRSAEEQLAEVQQNLAVTLASIDAAFLATNADGHVTHINSVASRILGWTEQEALGHILWEVFPRDDRPAEFLNQNPLDVVARLGYTVDVGVELMAISRSGARTPVEVKAALTHAADGSVRGLAVVFRDLTNRLQAEAESGRLAAIVESSNDAIIGKTLDGRITSWNRAAEGLFGYTADQAIGQPVQMLIPADRLHEEMRILAQLAHGEVVPPFDTVRRARSGRLVDVSLSISPIRNASGQIIGASKIVRDARLQRRAEEAQRRSDAQLRFTLEAAQIGDWSEDFATGEVLRSLRHDRCFGYDTPQPGWTKETVLAHLLPEDRPDMIRGVAQAVATLGGFSVDFRVRWPDGSVHWLATHGTVRHEGGQARGLLGITTEITQQKLAEQARLTAQRLEAENRQVLEANRLKSQFLANMSHELRTPLNAIIGFADLLHAGAVAPDSPKHREFLGHIGTSGRHLLQLINDVLDLSKVESGKLVFHPEAVQLPRIVAEVSNVLHTGALRKGITLRTEIDPELDDPAGLGTLVLDPARLKQALYNYLSNAIKFTPEGGAVTVRARAEDARRWRLEVQDTGIGIAAADLPRLFNDFQQLDVGYDKAHQGTGLGLALTRRLVEAQGGSVGVSSTPGVGSIFYLVMDRQPAAEQAPRRLLVVQGDVQHQARLVGALADAGFQVDGAGNGQQALALAKDQAYQAITLDLVLPDQQGLRLLDRIRDQGKSRDAAVVGVSLRGADAGSPGGPATFAVADVLFKPLRTDQVARVLGGYGDRLPKPARVMVIDDDPLALSLMQATLAGLGITAVCMPDAQQALREIDAHQPDAIVLDLMMPGFDGFAVLDALQRMPLWRDVPVYVWTSMLLSDEELHLLRRSVSAILHKGGGGVEPLLNRLRLARAQPTPEAGT